MLRGLDFFLLSLLVVVHSQSYDAARTSTATVGVAPDALTLSEADATRAAALISNGRRVQEQAVDEEEGGKGKGKSKGKGKRGKGKRGVKGKGGAKKKAVKAAKAAKAAKAEAKKQDTLAHEAATEARRVACPQRASGLLSKVLRTTLTPIPPGTRA